MAHYYLFRFWFSAKQLIRLSLPGKPITTFRPITRGRRTALRIAQLSSPWSWFKRKIGRYHRRRYQVVRGQLGNRERRGPKTVSFAATQSENGYQNVRVLVDAGNASFENSVRIPIVKPSIVITSFLKDQSVKPGDEVAFQALPFFFNVDSLKNSPFLADKQSVGGRGRQQTYD